MKITKKLTYLVELLILCFISTSLFGIYDFINR